nr:hypothetical protein [Candidatus Krumholzibacteria bacterium]
MTLDIACQFRLDIGGNVLGFHCDPAGFAPYLSYWFDRPSTLAAPDISLQLTLIPHEETLDLPNTLLKTKRLTGNGGFDIHDGLFQGRFDAATGQGEIAFKAALARGQLMRVSEQIFYQAFHSARQRKGTDCVMVHSSAVIAGGQGFLFVGPSEAGKSTAARNSAAHHVLGDEMNLVHFTPQGLFVEGTPFNGFFRDKKPGRAPLRAVFLLNQAPEHRIVPMGAAEAAGLLAAEIVPLVGLDQVPGPQTVPDMVEAAARIVAGTHFARLDLLP